MTTKDGQPVAGDSPHTVKKTLNVLRKALRNAKRRGLYSGDVDTVIPEYSAQYEPRKRWLSWDEVDKLLGQFKRDQARKAQVAFALATGARDSEVYRVRREDVENYVVRIPGTKTQRSNRTIPIVGEFRRLLDLALDLAPCQKRSELLFPQRWHSARRDILAACERAKIPGCTWNDLRRTVGSLLKQGGARNEDIAAILGNSVEMVEKVYGRDTTEALGARIAAAAQRTKTTQRTTVHRRKAEK